MECEICSIWLYWMFSWLVQKVKNSKRKTRMKKNRKSQLWKTSNLPSMQTTERLDKPSTCWHWLWALKKGQSLKIHLEQDQITSSLALFYLFVDCILKELLSRTLQTTSHPSLKRTVGRCHCSQVPSYAFLMSYHISFVPSEMPAR